MTRTIFLTSLMCSALALGCGDDKTPGQTTNPSTNPSSAEEGDSSESGGNEETGGNEGTANNPTTDGPGTTTNDGTDPTNVTGMTTNVTSETDVNPTAGTTTCGFICQDDTPTGECDVFAQDCPEGEKCAAYADDGGSSWNNTKCVAVTGDGQHGDPCTTEGGGTTGVDDCALGFMCWDVVDDKGTCVALCTGSADAPKCIDDLVCVIANDGVLNLCLTPCDPLLQDCPGDDLCIPNGEEFVCVLDASGEEGQVHDVCEFVNACAKGLTCQDAATASSECDPAAAGCCEPFCEFPDGACPAADQVCFQWFDPVSLPKDDPKLAIGVCVIPQ